MYRSAHHASCTSVCCQVPFRSKAGGAEGEPGYDAGASQSAAFLDREWTQQEWQDWMDRSWGEQVG